MKKNLDYDEAAAVRMLVELRQLDRDKRIDTLAVVIKAFVECMALDVPASTTEGS